MISGKILKTHGVPVGFQETVVLPLPSVAVAGGASPVGLVFTVTCAPETGWPFLLTTISTDCSSPGLIFACLTLTSTFRSALVAAPDEAGAEPLGAGVLLVLPPLDGLLAVVAVGVGEGVAAGDALACAVLLPELPLTATR